MAKQTVKSRKSAPVVDEDEDEVDEETVHVESDDPELSAYAESRKSANHLTVQQGRDLRSKLMRLRQQTGHRISASLEMLGYRGVKGKETPLREWKLADVSVNKEALELVQEQIRIAAMDLKAFAMILESSK